MALKTPWLKWSFPAFVVGHTILTYEFYHRHKNIPLLIQNSYFAMVNIIATYIWFFK